MSENYLMVYEKDAVTDKMGLKCMTPISAVSGGSGSPTAINLSSSVSGSQVTITPSGGGTAAVFNIPNSGSVSLSASVNTSSHSSQNLQVNNNGSPSFSVNIERDVQVSASPPSTLFDGRMWKTSPSTPNPHPKNCLMSYNQSSSRWMMVSGDARAEMYGNISSPPTSVMNQLSFSTSSNTSGGDTTTSGFTARADGLYDVALWFHAGSTHSWSNSPLHSGILLNLKVDGVAVMSDSHTQYGNSSDSDVTRPVSIVVNSVPLNNGQTLSAELFVLSGTLNASVSLRVVRRV